MGLVDMYCHARIMWFVSCCIIFSIICGIIAISLINVSRDMVKVTALMINGYTVVLPNGKYSITRIYEYTAGSREHTAKTISTKQYNSIELANTLSNKGIGELVDIYYEKQNPRNISETRGGNWLWGLGFGGLGVFLSVLAFVGYMNPELCSVLTLGDISKAFQGTV